MRRTILALATVALAVLTTAAVAQAYPGQHRAPHHDRAIDRGASVVDRAVMVEWGNSWWDAEILEARGDRYLITYTGWSSSWDEWVGPERIRARGHAATRTSQTRSVQILWGGSWYPGAVLDRRGDRYLVTYDGYSASWDEWVGTDRLRFTEAPRERRPHRAPAQRRWSRR